MIKLRKNERKDLYIFFASREVRKLTHLTAKFKEEPIEPLREICWWSYGIWRKFELLISEETLVKKVEGQCFNVDVTSFQQVLSVR